jgi:hypothetical protein
MRFAWHRGCPGHSKLARMGLSYWSSDRIMKVTGSFSARTSGRANPAGVADAGLRDPRERLSGTATAAPRRRPAGRTADRRPGSAPRQASAQARPSFPTRGHGSARPRRRRIGAELATSRWLRWPARDPHSWRHGYARAAQRRCSACSQGMEGSSRVLGATLRCSCQAEQQRSIAVAT